MTKIALETLLINGNIELNPSQNSVSFPIIERIYKKMINGISIRKGILVSEDLVIVDGHHRYLASLFANVELATSIAPLSLAKEMIDWEAVKVDDADWDSKKNIDKHNELDAYCNGITTEQLLELIG